MDSFPASSVAVTVMRLFPASSQSKVVLFRRTLGLSVQLSSAVAIVETSADNVAEPEASKFKSIVG